MNDALIRYGLFLAETITLVVALLVAIGALVAMANRQSRAARREPDVELKNLNRSYEEMSRAVRDQMLAPAAAKAARRADKRRDKADAREQRRFVKQHQVPVTVSVGSVTEVDVDHGPPPPSLTGQPPTGQPPAPRPPTHRPPNGPSDSLAIPARPRVFVLDFHGDLRANQVSQLREEVTAVLMTATEQDEVLVRLENPGGTVHEQGLAASQLQRLKDHGIRLTVAVDKVAASGGYMMACVAHRILAAPFAVVGSIGVIDQMPNFHRLLDRAGVDYEMFKGGDAKRTVTMFGKNTDEDRSRRKEQVQEIHDLFKRFVAGHRPHLDLSQVATGQYWYGARALELGLVDELITSDDYLLAARRRADLYLLRVRTRPSLRQRLTGAVSVLVPVLSR